MRARELLARPAVAVAVVLGVYVVLMGQGVIDAVAHLHVPFGVVSYGWWSGAATAAGELGLAALVALGYLLLGGWLCSPRVELGLPRRGRFLAADAAIVGTLVTGFGAMLLATPLLMLGPSSNQPVAQGGWATWMAMAASSLRTAVQEEVVVVALPALLLRRAGLPGWTIVVISAVLRAPYHVYHGLFALPWAVIWGGGYALAYLRWRRLAPLVIMHAALDIVVYSGQIFGPSARHQAVLASLLLAAVVMAAALVEEHRHRLANHQRAAARRFLAGALGRRPGPWLVSAAVAAVLAADTLEMLAGGPVTTVGRARAGLLAAAAFGAAVAGRRLLAAFLLWSTSVLTLRGADGRVWAVVTWSARPRRRARLLHISCAPGRHRAQAAVAATRQLAAAADAVELTRLGTRAPGLLAAGFTPRRLSWFPATRWSLACRS